MSTRRTSIEDLLRATLAERARPHETPPSPTAGELIDLDLECELMALLLDSAESELVHRGEPWRVLRFAADGIELDLEVDGPAHLVVGEISAGDAVAVEAMAPDWSHVASVDELGRFRLPLGEATSVRFRLRLADGRVVVTPVIRLPR